MTKSDATLARAAALVAELDALMRERNVRRAEVNAFEGEMPSLHFQAQTDDDLRAAATELGTAIAIVSTHPTWEWDETKQVLGGVVISLSGPHRRKATAP